MRLKKTCLLIKSLLLSCLISFSSYAATPTFSVATLKFGTVNWTLETIKRHKLDQQNGFTLNIHAVASTQASKIALQAGAVNIIVSDWVWVARQRSSGINLSFSPYSSATGSLIVAKDSNIKSILDLSGKKLGIAGGPLDKNWLLLQALATTQNLNLNTQTTTVFAAPPLLNQQIKQARLDALLNFWHYGARLEAQGYQKLLDTHEVLKQLGIKENIPMLGYVFKEQWGNNNKTVLSAFFKASQQAAALLCNSDSSWNDITPLTRTEDPKTRQALREGYCAGRIKSWRPEHKQAASQMFKILASHSGKKLVGNASTLDPQTFWTP